MPAAEVHSFVDCLGYKLALFHLILLVVHTSYGSQYPIVINTWAFTNASINAWEVLEAGGSALDAVEKGCTTCEIEQCDGTVGYGGSPDENGETTLDAMIMDGNNLNVGAVAGLRRIKAAASVARSVLDFTTHSLLVGDLATAFAKSQGFKEESLTSNRSFSIFQTWKENNCQPNFWTNVIPDPTTACGPYRPNKQLLNNHLRPFVIGEHNHDTIGILALDSFGNIASGTSSNGASHKIAGRVGDSPIPGAGSYADSKVGAAAATGDGDVMMRFLPSFVAVEEMRRGSHPRVAAEEAIRRIVDRHPMFTGGIVVLRNDGKFAAACHGLDSFPYVVSNPDMKAIIFRISCV